jgi:alcohol dehydrogenase class IV
LISVGGGSPIDATKVIAFKVHEQTGSWFPSIAIPTTLSAAETTALAGYTNADGHKVGLAHPEIAPKGASRVSTLFRARADMNFPLTPESNDDISDPV